MSAQPASSSNPFELAAPKIREAVYQGEPDGVLSVLSQTDADAAVPLHDQFREAQRKHALGLIGIEDWGRAQAQLYRAVFDLDWMKVSEVRQECSVQSKSQIIQLLQQRKTEQALALCEGFGDQFLLFHAQLDAAKKQSGLGLMESEYWESIKSRVNYALLGLMDQVPEKEQRKGFFERIRRFFE